jgi:hypothetical protein
MITGLSRLHRGALLQLLISWWRRPAVLIAFTCPCPAVIRQDINLTRTEASGAAIASITGATVICACSLLSDLQVHVPLAPPVLLTTVRRMHVLPVNILTVAGTCFSRIAMGSFCDAFGPRMGHIMILSLTSAPGAFKQ